MTAKEKIISILKKEDRVLTPSEIAEITNDKNIKAFEADSIARLNPEIFCTDGSKIGLTEWDTKKEISHLAKRIIDIINAYEKETPVEMIVEAIKNLYDEFPDTTEQDIQNEIKNNRLFILKEGEVDTLFDSYKITKDVFEYMLPSWLEEKKLKELSSIKSFGISNFKAYKNLQKFEIKPITLLFGPNSAGKSSFIHSLLYFSNAMANNELSPNYMTISGDSVDLGGFKQLIYKENYKNKLQFKIELEKDNLGDNLKKTFENVKNITINIEISQPHKHTEKNVEVERRWLELPGIEIPDGEPIVSKYEIVTDTISLLSIKTSEKANIFMLDSLNYNNEIIKSIVQKSIGKNDMSKVEEVIERTLSELLIKLFSKANSIVPKNLFYSELEFEKIYKAYKAKSKKISKRDEAIKKSIILNFPTELNTILSDIFDLLDSQFSELKYLGPMRSYPPRQLLSDNDINSFEPNYFSGGEFAWHRLREDQELREKVNTWLSSDKLKTKYKLEKRTLIDMELGKVKDLVFQAEENAIVEQEGALLNKIYETIEENAKTIGAVDDLVLIDKNSNTVVSHKDVGFGISQVIPVLVSAYDNKNKTVLIEQPEIHLHPALQAELTDMFVENAVGENKNTFILETHSEHLLRRLQVLVAKRELNKKDLAVYYIDKKAGEVKASEMGIKDDGFFKEPWPDGFFDEASDLAWQLMKTQADRNS